MERAGGNSGGDPKAQCSCKLDLRPGTVGQVHETRCPFYRDPLENLSWPVREDLEGSWEGYRPADEVMLPECRWWQHPLVTIAIVVGLLFFTLFLVLQMG